MIVLIGKQLALMTPSGVIALPQATLTSNLALALVSLRVAQDNLT